MNKLFFTILLVCFLLPDAQSQGLNIGDKISFGHSWTVGNRPSSDKYKFHPFVQVGRSAVVNFNENAGLGFGTFFSTEGVSFYNETNKVKTEMRTNYIRVPVFANFVFGDPVNRVRPKLSFGPTVGFLVGGKTFGQNQNDQIAGLKTVKAMNTKIDAGASVALGWNVRVMEGFSINQDINYYHGLVTNETTGGSRFTHRNLGVSMGMQINTDAMRKWKSKMHSNNNFRDTWHYKHRRPGNY